MGLPLNFNIELSSFLNNRMLYWLLKHTAQGMDMVDYNYTNADRPEIKQAIENANNMKYIAKTINVAYGTLMNHRDIQEDPNFNKYFEVVPAARIDSFGPNGLEEVVRHGLIVTCPNVKDEYLPPEAIIARERAVAIAILAATYVIPPVNTAAARQTAGNVLPTSNAAAKGSGRTAA